MSRSVRAARGWAFALSLAAIALPSRAQEPAGAARDRHFEEFVRKTAGTMVADVAVESEHHMKVKVRESVTPESVLPLTKSLMAGARRDFPEEMITVAVYDPAGKPILRARFRPGKGVDYEVVHNQGREHHEFAKHPGGESGTTAPAPAPSPSAAPTPSAMPRAGRTEKDVKFAQWAEQKGREYLRYVESDLENHGRLWFGVTRAVKPADVPALTKSLLEGAHSEFPRRELVATVFDPEGEKIGTATLATDGQIHWVK